jgi:ribosomal protein S27E
MHHIIAKLITDIQKNKNGTAETKAKTKNIQQRKKFLTLEIAECNQQVIFYHGLTFKNCTCYLEMRHRSSGNNIRNCTDFG